MYMPTLLRNFLYNIPKSGNHLMDFLMWLVSRELHCTATFCRNFYWSDYNLWPQHMPDRTLVVLSGGDVLCPSEEVKSWLEEETCARVSEGVLHVGDDSSLAMYDVEWHVLMCSLCDHGVSGKLSVENAASDMLTILYGLFHMFVDICVACAAIRCCTILICAMLGL